MYAEDQAICVSVPCKDGLLEDSVKLTAISSGVSSVNIAVTPDSLDSSTLGNALLQDFFQCYDPERPVGATITCGEQPPAGQYTYLYTCDNGCLSYIGSYILVYIL